LERTDAKSAMKTSQVRIISPNYAYVTIVIVALVFALIMYRASNIIQKYNPHINSKLYFWTHLLTIFIELVLWLIIARSAIRFKSYTLTVIKNADGKALNYIANSILISLAYAILFSMASTIKTLFWRNPNLKTITTITNLVPLLAILIASFYILIGTQQLRHLSHSRLRDSLNLRPFLSILFVFIITYSMYFYQDAPKVLDDDGLHHFTLSSTTLLFVYVLPYIVVWTIGVFSCINLVDYASNVKGVIYKSLFSDLRNGLIISFIGTYLVQIFDVSSFNSNTFGVGFVILLLILALIIRGYLLIFRGTNQLYKLET
jgi:hypothetical protein